MDWIGRTIRLKIFTSLSSFSHLRILCFSTSLSSFSQSHILRFSTSYSSFPTVAFISQLRIRFQFRILHFPTSHSSFPHLAFIVSRLHTLRFSTLHSSPIFSASFSQPPIPRSPKTIIIIHAIIITHRTGNTHDTALYI